MAYPREASETYCPTGECLWDSASENRRRAKWCGPCEEHFGETASLEEVRAAMQGQPSAGVAAVEAREDASEALVLHKVKLGLSAVVGEDVLRSLRFEEVHDLVADEIVYTIRAYLLGSNVKREVVDSVKVPETWWDAFKAQYFPYWLLRRFPDRARYIDENVVHTHVCPHLNVTEEREHLQFLTPELEEQP
jgi:hypothetical protein